MSDHTTGLVLSQLVMILFDIYVDTVYVFFQRCLDMCAAPGSKTTQLLEIISQSWGRASDTVSGDDHSDDSVISQPLEGLVVANDSDTNR